MLQTIEIDGFRSLIDFKLSFQPGLNVIVGANGAGKSNFVSFLDFLGELFESDLNSAIAVVHGAGSLFSKERISGEKTVDLTFKLEGYVHSPSGKERGPLFQNLEEVSEPPRKYSYRCTISYLTSVPSVFISSESITVDVNDQDLTVIRKTERTEEGFKTRVHFHPSDHKLTKTIFRWIRQQQEKKFDAEEYLASRLTPERSVLLYLSAENAAFEAVLEDLIRYRSVNIDPNTARKPSPVGSIASLRSNGEGLAGALYQLKNDAYFPGRAFRRFGRRHVRTENVFESIISWCREVNPSIEGIKVDLDVMEAQIRPFMLFHHGGLAHEEFSFNRISDGTVKWLALTTVLFAEPGLSIIEEPENFLHPLMQEAFIALCRQAIERDPTRSVIISTHSPTLLDCCKPYELTLFELIHGKTRASAIGNRNELAQKVKQSRFGLGYYYRIGALYGEDSGDS